MLGIDKFSVVIRQKYYLQNLPFIQFGNAKKISSGTILLGYAKIHGNAGVSGY